ncbi:MAG: LysR family transcriptional regulator, partial [Burkholderiaceae bacterium]|nr:LysR family transcriptional regulator [Burkholderiaceae bacterium]
TFREAARTENLRATAERLHLTHSAVSQQMRQLEQQLGFALFERRGRSLALNAAGAALRRSVEAALDLIDEGVRAATLAAEGKVQTLRVTVLPSFAQRWLLPRMARWRERHPGITLELHASQALADLPREGFHAAVRAGTGPWRGLVGEQLGTSRFVAVGAPARAAHVRFGDHAALAAEPLLGHAEKWSAFLSLCGCKLRGKTVAEFNDAGLLLQAAEQDLGVALASELLAADALQAGRLVRLSPLTLADVEPAPYWFVYPPQHAELPALQALRQWLLEEMALSRAQLAESGR